MISTEGQARPNEPADLDVLAGRSVRQLRLFRGMSRTALGRACGVSGQQIDKYETGANRMAISRFDEIAAALGTDAARLMKIAREGGHAAPRQEALLPAKPRPPKSVSQKAKTAELMRLGLDMDETLLDHLLALARAAAR